MDKFTLPTAQGAEKALRLPIGAASPLWFAFAGAAAIGAAYWWSTRWLKPVNLEALATLPAATLEAVADEVVEAAPQPVAEVAAALAPEPAAPLAEPDDLTRLTGIGPKLAAALAARGVTSFAQIAAWTADDLTAVDSDLKLLGRAERDAWVAQAKRLTEQA